MPVLNIDSRQGKLDAFIFDMDGVMVDSEYWWERVEMGYLVHVAPGWDASQYPSLTGMSHADIYNTLSTVSEMKVSHEQFRRDLDDMARQIYSESVSLAVDLTGVLQSLNEANIPCAVASSSPRPWIDMILDRFEMNDRFHSITSGEELPSGRGKPEPDIFLLAAERLGVSPGGCGVIEDSLNGLRAAKRAGMFSFAYAPGELPNTMAPFTDVHLDGGFSTLASILKKSNSLS